MMCNLKRQTKKGFKVMQHNEKVIIEYSRMIVCFLFFSRLEKLVAVPVWYRFFCDCCMTVL
jgi:hypothetical protein